MEMCPAARLTRNDGTVKGESRRMPLMSVVRTASAIAGNPPIPDAITVAVRWCDRASSGFQLACAIASSAARSANRMKRSILRWSLRGATRSGSKPPSGSTATSGTWPPTFALRSAVIASGSVRMPDRPASRRDQLVSTPQPSGDTAPIPVTTIRRIFYPVSIGALTCLTWQRQLGLANFLATASPRILAKRAASGSRQDRPSNRRRHQPVMPSTAVLNKIRLSARGLKDGKSFFDEKLLKLTDLEHFAHDVASADEFALDVELRDRGPVGVDLDAIPQFGRVVHIERLVRDPNVFENLDHLTRKSTLWKLRGAFHEEHDVVRPYFVLDELFDAHDLISSLCCGTQRPL